MENIQNKMHDSKKNTILLVEDNPDDIELTVHELEKDNYYNIDIVVCPDGASAIDYLFNKGKYIQRDAEDMPVLILLDLKLPKVSGMEVLKRIRSDNRTRLIPVVVLTTSDEEQDIIRSYGRGANSFIRKPVSFKRFREIVHQLKSYWLLLNEIPPEAYYKGVSSTQ